MDLVQKRGSNMPASEIVIRDGGISERVMSDVLADDIEHCVGRYEWRNKVGGDRLLKKNDTKPNLRMVSIVGMNEHEEWMERNEWW